LLTILGSLRTPVLRAVVKQVVGDTNDPCPRVFKRREAFMVKWLYERREFIRAPVEKAAETRSPARPPAASLPEPEKPAIPSSIFATQDELMDLQPLDFAFGEYLGDEFDPCREDDICDFS
jgi:hypothetical protein